MSCQYFWFWRVWRDLLAGTLGDMPVGIAASMLADMLVDMSVGIVTSMSEGRLAAMPAGVAASMSRGRLADMPAGIPAGMATSMLASAEGDSIAGEFLLPAWHLFFIGAGVYLMRTGKKQIFAFKKFDILYT